MTWVSVNTRKPKLGQKCYCYYVMETITGTIIKDTRVLYYLKYHRDTRRRVFSDKSQYFHELNHGETSWPVTHWMPEPKPPPRNLCTRSLTINFKKGEVVL